MLGMELCSLGVVSCPPARPHSIAGQLWGLGLCVGQLRNPELENEQCVLWLM